MKRYTEVQVVSRISRGRGKGIMDMDTVQKFFFWGRELELFFHIVNSRKDEAVICLSYVFICSPSEEHPDHVAK